MFNISNKWTFLICNKTLRGNLKPFLPGQIIFLYLYEELIFSAVVPCPLHYPRVAGAHWSSYIRLLQVRSCSGAGYLYKSHSGSGWITLKWCVVQHFIWDLNANNVTFMYQDTKIKVLRAAKMLLSELQNLDNFSWSNFVRANNRLNVSMYWTIEWTLTYPDTSHRHLGYDDDIFI